MKTCVCFLIFFIAAALPATELRPHIAVPHDWSLADFAIVVNHNQQLFGNKVWWVEWKTPDRVLVRVCMAGEYSSAEDQEVEMIHDSGSG